MSAALTVWHQSTTSFDTHCDTEKTKCHLKLSVKNIWINWQPFKVQAFCIVCLKHNSSIQELIKDVCKCLKLKCLGRYWTWEHTIKGVIHETAQWRAAWFVKVSLYCQDSKIKEGIMGWACRWDGEMHIFGIIFWRRATCCVQDEMGSWYVDEFLGSTRVLISP